MSPFVPKVKVDGIKRFGAEIRIAGQNQDEAELEALKLMRTEGLIYLSAFDHPDVIAGQGTLGLELVEDWPDMDTVVVPLSGGGLLAGIAAALKALSPDTRLIGVSMDRGPAMYNSLHAGTPVTVIEEPTLADSLSGGIGLDNRYTFRMIRDLVDETVLVSETEIARAMRILYQEQQIIVEGGAAVGIAALLAQKICVKGRKVAAILSGRNIDMTLFQRIANGEDVDLAKNPSAGSIMK
jgi:threonine dehydratase